MSAQVKRSAWTWSTALMALFAVFSFWTLPACPGPDGMDAGNDLAQAVFVVHDGVVSSWDIATGNERAGTVTNVPSPTDPTALSDGTILVNSSGAHVVVAIDGRTMLEKTRIPSSGTTGRRPVHAYLSPDRGGKQLYMALNDGQGGVANTNTALFIHAKPGATNFLTVAGEVQVGLGHHKAAFSNTTDRVVITNIGDCSNVASVYDYSNPASITSLATFNAHQLGWDGGSRATTCDPTFANGAPPAPHGCATSKLTGKVFCNLTANGTIIAIDVDRSPPDIKTIATSGSGSGYTAASLDGRYIYTLQESPREGEPGAGPCQIGQLVAIDAMTEAVVREVPLFYDGAGCTRVLAGTDEGQAEPGHILVSSNGRTLYIGTAGAFGQTAARVRRELVVDITSPAQPVQQASITVGSSTGHHGDTLSGDGRHLFVANNAPDGGGNTVTQIDTATNQVVRTITAKTAPAAVTTFGTAEGPGYQTGPIH